MKQAPFIAFVCEHGAAKSIIAAAYFNKLASEMDLDARAIARGTSPDSEMSIRTVTGLREDGLSPTETIPQKLSLAEIRSAHHVVTFCELPSEYRSDIPAEQWDDVPSVSKDYGTARDVILSRLKTLMERMISGQ